MGRRVSFAIAVPVTILGFWFASVLLIILIGVASHKTWVPRAQTQALTQAYYYAIFAAGLYQIISYLVRASLLFLALESILLYWNDQLDQPC